MSQLRCPTCHQQFDPEQSRAMPFCSDRCRRIDLNRWLTEEISIPVNEDEAGDPDGPQRHRDEAED